MVIDGVVVLYNPVENVIGNISTYSSLVRTLYVVDNSELKCNELIDAVSSIPNVVYLDNKGNRGIAQALNVGAECALSAGANWLLTMDQDSSFAPDSFEKMLGYLHENLDFMCSSVGILSPLHQTKGKTKELGGDVVEVDVVMTSGNLLNLKAYQSVGHFRDKYFIDSVDHEYCLRLKKNGYKVVILKPAVLTHELGNIEYKKVLGRKIYYTNHGHVRRYYMTRNRLDIVANYLAVFPRFCIGELIRIFTDWVKIMLFEKDKSRKQAAILKGFADFLLRRFGRLDG